MKREICFLLNSDARQVRQILNDDYVSYLREMLERSRARNFLTVVFLRLPLKNLFAQSMLTWNRSRVEFSRIFPARRIERPPRIRAILGTINRRVPRPGRSPRRPLAKYTSREVVYTVDKCL